MTDRTGPHPWHPLRLRQKLSLQTPGGPTASLPPSRPQHEVSGVSCRALSHLGAGQGGYIKVHKIPAVASTPGESPDEPKTGSSHSVRESDLRNWGCGISSETERGPMLQQFKKRHFHNQSRGTRKQRGKKEQNPQGIMTQVLSEPQSRSCRPSGSSHGRLRPGGEQLNPPHVLNVGGLHRGTRAPCRQNCRCQAHHGGVASESPIVHLGGPACQASMAFLHDRTGSTDSNVEKVGRSTRAVIQSYTDSA